MPQKGIQCTSGASMHVCACVTLCSAKNYKQSVSKRKAEGGQEPMTLSWPTKSPWLCPGQRRHDSMGCKRTCLPLVTFSYFCSTHWLRLSQLHMFFCNNLCYRPIALQFVLTRSAASTPHSTMDLRAGCALVSKEDRHDTEGKPADASKRRRYTAKGPRQHLPPSSATAIIQWGQQELATEKLFPWRATPTSEINFLLSTAVLTRNNLLVCMRVGWWTSPVALHSVTTVSTCLLQLHIAQLFSARCELDLFQSSLAADWHPWLRACSLYYRDLFATVAIQGQAPTTPFVTSFPCLVSPNAEKACCVCVCHPLFHRWTIRFQTGGRNLWLSRRPDLTISDIFLFLFHPLLQAVSAAQYIYIYIYIFFFLVPAPSPCSCTDSLPQQFIVLLRACASVYVHLCLCVDVRTHSCVCITLCFKGVWGPTGTDHPQRTQRTWRVTIIQFQPSGSSCLGAGKSWCSSKQYYCLTLQLAAPRHDFRKPLTWLPVWPSGIEALILTRLTPSADVHFLPSFLEIILGLASRSCFLCLGGCSLWIIHWQHQHFHKQTKRSTGFNGFRNAKRCTNAEGSFRGRVL